jgi:hypothetical protein
MQRHAMGVQPAGCGRAIETHRIFAGNTAAPHEIVILRESGVSSTPQLFDSITAAVEYWITGFRG